MEVYMENISIEKVRISYIGIHFIAVGAAFASLLLWAFDGGKENPLSQTLREKVKQVINGTKIKE
jgi:hypothetical protein